MTKSPENAAHSEIVHLDPQFVTPQVEAMIGVNPDVNPSFLDQTPQSKSDVKPRDPMFVIPERPEDIRARANALADATADKNADDAHARFVAAQKSYRQLANTGFKHLVDADVDTRNPNPQLGKTHTSGGYLQSRKSQ